MRNSVKAVVDAYDGTVKLYQWDTEDPVLKTWQKAFPGVVQPKSGDLRRSCWTTCATRRTTSRCSARSWPSTTRPTRTTGTRTRRCGRCPTTRSRRPRQAKESPFYLSVKWPEDDRRDLLPDHRLRAARPVQPGGLHGGQRRRQQPRLRPDPRPADVRHHPDRRAGTVVQRHDDQRDGRANGCGPSSRARRSRQFGNLLTLPVGGGLLYVTPVYTQRPGQHGLLPGAALRRGAVRPVGGHRRHPPAGAGPGVQGQLRRQHGGGRAGRAEPSRGRARPTAPPRPRRSTEAQAAFEAADKALAAATSGTYQTPDRGGPGRHGRARCGRWAADRRPARQRVTTPRTRVVVAPPTQTVPSSACSTSTTPARPTRVPCPAR